MTDKKQPEALAFCWATELAMTQQPVTLSVTEAREVSAEMQRQHAELETLRTGYDAARLEIESLRAAQPAPQPGAAYAALPEYGINTASHAHFRVLGFTADQMRAFADATHALRASHGQASDDLLKVALAYKDYIDALPSDVVATLPAMPGIDGDWAAGVLDRAARAPADSQPAWASQAVIEYRYTGGTRWCPLGPAERMKPNFDGVYRLQGGVFPVDASADSVLEDAARYHYLRDVPMERWPAELLTAIRLQQNAKWDAAIDAARAAQEGK